MSIILIIFILLVLIYVLAASEALLLTISFIMTISIGTFIVYKLTQLYKEDTLTIKQLNTIVLSIIVIIFILIAGVPISANNDKELYIEREKACCVDNGGSYTPSDYKKGNGYHCSLLTYMTDYDSSNSKRREGYERYKEYFDCHYEAMKDIFGDLEEYYKAFDIE